MGVKTRAQVNRQRTLALALGFTGLIFLLTVGIFSIAGAPVIGLAAGILVAFAAFVVARSKATELVLDLCEAEAAVEPEHSRLFNTTAGLCAAMGVAPPNLYVVDDPAINAISVGVDPRNAALAITSGALEELTLLELEGVLALQLHRIRSGDIVPETLAVTTLGLPLALSEMADRWAPLSRALAASAPLVMPGLRKLHSRMDELDTDLAAVRYTRFPPGLAAALEKMQGRSALAVGAPVTAHLWIASPLPPAARLAPAVHATLEERVAVLQEL